jgi:hypothetical protein
MEGWDRLGCFSEIHSTWLMRSDLLGPLVSVRLFCRGDKISVANPTLQNHSFRIDNNWAKAGVEASVKNFSWHCCSLQQAIPKS